MNNEEFKKLWKNIFNEEWENKETNLIDGSFFRQRNNYAHGDFKSTDLNWEQLEKYFDNMIKIANLFSDEIDNFMKQNKHLCLPL